jgi:hypothetical protein
MCPTHQMTSPWSQPELAQAQQLSLTEQGSPRLRYPMLSPLTF